jgi:hypothetical protein
VMMTCPLRRCVHSVRRSPVYITLDVMTGQRSFVR